MSSTRKVIDRLLHWLKAPTGHESIETVRTATLWYTILCAGGGALGYLTLASFLPADLRARAYLVGGIAFATCLGGLMAIRCGRPKYVAGGLLGMILVVLSVSSWTTGGIRAPGNLTLIASISLAGILLNVRASAYMALACFAVFAFQIFAELKGFLPAPTLQHSVFSTGLTLTFCIWLLLSTQAIAERQYGKAALKALEDNENRRRAEHDLQESKEKFAAIFDNLSEGIFIHDPDTGRILDVNRRASEMYGYSKAELIALPPGELSSGGIGYTDADALQWIKKARFEGPQAFEWQARHRNGLVFWVEVNIRREIIAGSETILVTLRDVTERKLLDERLRQTQKLEVFGQIAGGVAHDFNNVLVVVLNNTQLLLESTPPDSGTASYLQEIADAGRRAAALTQQLLLFSRNEKAQLTAANLNTVVDGITRMLRRVIGEHYDLRLQFTSADLPVLVDTIMMEQVLMNLVVNARDSMPSGGPITVVTEKIHVADTGGSWSGYPAGDYAVFRVKDCGTGISQETLKHLYEPFFTTKPAGKGTGLGLAVVLGIIKQHHGRITVSTELGKGSEFVVSLPFSSLVPTEAPPSPALPSALTATAPSTILLVEDNEMVAKVAERALTVSGYKVRKTENAVEALELIERDQEKIDLILSDVVMPGGMSGAEFADIVRKRWPDTRIILMSGYNEEVTDSDAAFLAKPFSAKQLLELVKRVLG